jgi:transposase InsO family protein
MKTHRSAKTNVYQRQLLVQRVEQEGWTQRRAAAAAGVSVRTVAKWLGRRAELEDRSSRPRRSPRRTDLVDETAIIRLRRTRATAWEISVALGIPRSTVTRVLARVGLNRVTAIDPVAPVQRYERARPGELLHVDSKRLGRIGGHVGHRIHGDRRTRIRGAGYESVHVAIDDATRLAYAEVLATDQGPACAAFLGRAVRWYSRRGIRIQRLLTDNAKAYRGHPVRAVCARWAIRHRFTRPYRPQTNGKAERLIQTLLRHWAYRWPYATSAQRTAGLRPYLRLYNHRRPHASLGRRSPWTCFQEAVAR